MVPRLTLSCVPVWVHSQLCLPPGRYATDSCERPVGLHSSRDVSAASVMQVGSKTCIGIGRSTCIASCGRICASGRESSCMKTCTSTHGSTFSNTCVGTRRCSRQSLPWFYQRACRHILDGSSVLIKVFASLPRSRLGIKSQAWSCLYSKFSIFVPVLLLSLHLLLHKLVRKQPVRVTLHLRKVFVKYALQRLHPSAPPVN